MKITNASNKEIEKQQKSIQACKKKIDKKLNLFLNFNDVTSKVNNYSQNLRMSLRSHEKKISTNSTMTHKMDYLKELYKSPKHKTIKPPKIQVKDTEDPLSENTEESFVRWGNNKDRELYRYILDLESRNVCSVSDLKNLTKPFPKTMKKILADIAIKTKWRGKI